MDESDYRESEDEDYKVEQVSEDEAESDVEETTAKAIQDQQQGDQTERFARTRSQVEAAPKDRTVEVKSSNVDVDALWAEMNTAPAPPKPPVATKSDSPATSTSTASSGPKGPNAPAEPLKSASKPSTINPSTLDDEMVTISRTYKFAGKLTTETKTVKATSAEGREFLNAQKAENKAQQIESSKPRRKGPVKRAMSLEDEFQAGKAKKLNTLAKSKLDWLGFVDSQGIQEDLKKHNKSGYLDKQDFLGRVDMNLERNQQR